MEQLSQQDQNFVKEIVLTGNQTQAAKDAYGITSDDYAGKKGSLKVREGKITTAIEEVKRTLAERIPDELLVRKHKELLNKIDSEGEIDVQAVSKGLDMGYKLKGAYAPEKSITVTIDANDPKARELAQRYEDELKKNL